MEKYEKGEKPVIITGLSDKWSAQENWTFANLHKKYGNAGFKVAQAKKGAIRCTMEEYIEYMAYNRDDSPLYLFEPNLEEHPYAKDMCKDYMPGPMF
jgi:histone arginine demethylase JMJD6